jgi:hypothetical protein
MTETTLQQAAESPALIASVVPTMILDCELRVRAVNAAYEAASLQTRDALLGQEVLVAFPDNPREPAGRSQLVSSLEHVLSRRERHHLGFLRYDIASPDNPDEYLPRVWSAVNSPILDGGRVVGVLEQVEDVTSIALGTAIGATEGEDPLNLAVALASATATVAALQEENSHLQRGMTSGRMIGAAIGILMSQNKVTRDQAFDLLRLRSQHSNRRLRDIAEELVDTGLLPAAQP